MVQDSRRQSASQEAVGTMTVTPRYTGTIMSISRTGSATVRTGDDHLVVISADEADHSGICFEPGGRITFRVDEKAAAAT